MQGYQIPRLFVLCRFGLLTRICIAKSFGSLDGRRHLVKSRLLAFYVLFQSSPSQEDLATFLNTEGEFVAELVQLLQRQWHVPEDLRTLALRALAGGLIFFLEPPLQQ